MIIRLRDRSESDRERHPTRRHAPLLTLLYYSPRRRHTTRNAHGGSGGDDGSGTFALSQPATTVRKVIRGFSRRRAPGFYTAATTCIPPPPRRPPPPTRRAWCPAAALDVLAKNWGHLDSSAPRQCTRGGALARLRRPITPSSHTLHTQCPAATAGPLPVHGDYYIIIILCGRA